MATNFAAVEAITIAGVNSMKLEIDRLNNQNTQLMDGIVEKDRTISTLTIELAEVKGKYNALKLGKEYALQIYNFFGQFSPKTPEVEAPSGSNHHIRGVVNSGTFHEGIVASGLETPSQQESKKSLNVLPSPLVPDPGQYINLPLDPINNSSDPINHSSEDQTLVKRHRYSFPPTGKGSGSRMDKNQPGSSATCNVVQRGTNNSGNN